MTTKAKHILQGRIAPQLNLKITQGDLDAGCQKDASSCAAARAVMRRFPEAQFIRADTKELSFSLPSLKRRFRYFMPAAGAQFVTRFDQGDSTLGPTTLRLNNGMDIPMGWQAKHPGSTRKARVYRRTGKKAIRYTKHRSFGACNIPQHQAEAILGGQEIAI